MKQYLIQFDRLYVCATFFKNGNTWLKQSTRTARITAPVEYDTQWFYFKNNELVVINSDSCEYD